MDIKYMLTKYMILIGNFKKGLTTSPNVPSEECNKKLSY